jgi:peptidoglycan/LPS O-acetylase OafA/YrhL
MNTTNRYRTIDGMRGIAALGVVVYHLSGNSGEELSKLLPEFINIIFSYGFLGVPVFFVISGFVISLSIGNSCITPKYAGNFILRRIIRLDPTYWATIVFSILLLYIQNYFLGTADPTPSPLNILAHMMYLQELLSIKPIISVVYWTLCLEVQLYLFYLLTSWLSQALSAKTGNKRHVIHMLLILSAGVYSTLVDRGFSSISVPGLFISNWHYFLMGVLVSNAVRKMPYSFYIFAAWIIFEITIQISVSVKAFGIAGILSSSLIFTLWRTDLLDTALTRIELQYLGKISYTLYLLHPEVGWKTISLGKHVLHDYMTPVLAGIIFIMGIFVSILFAHIFHIALERPSLWLSSKLKKASLSTVYYDLISRNNK